MNAWVSLIVSGLFGIALIPLYIKIRGLRPIEEVLQFKSVEEYEKHLRSSKVSEPKVKT